MWLKLQSIFDEVIKIDGDNDYKLKHMNKVRLERLGQLPTVIIVSTEARQHIEDRLDEDYKLSPEEEEEMNALEKQYGDESGYKLPDAISLVELEELQ
jgi:diketogulonate reductase-like aldo/keto reductase